MQSSASIPREGTYKWRRRKTIVRHILLQFANWMKRKENKATIAASTP
jgi:hypothetical protein